MSEQQINYDLMERPNMFESPESIARHILEVDKSKAGTINKDSARANLNPSELRAVRANGDLISELEYAERICGWDLKEAKDYVKEKLETTNVPSRSKSGFAIVLSKTDRRIQMGEAQEFAGEIQDQFDEKVEESLASKIPLIGGMFKKKELK
jgi:hypothetical protein